jgi:glycosyltransferase involved in cell wall biosynthesis
MLNFIRNFFSKKTNLKVQTFDKINLLIELSTFDKGGLQKVVLDSALKFAENEINITIISVEGCGYLSDVAKDKGLDVYELPLFNKERYYKKIIKEKKINLSNSHFSSFGYKILKSYKIPNVTFIHNIYAFLSGKALQQLIDDDKYVDIYISVSNKCTEYAVSKLGIDAKKIVTIPNGLILDEHYERSKNIKPLLRSNFGILDNDYVFINPASYNLHKGHYVMADAMKKILEKRSDIKILCVGNVVYEPHYKDLVSYLKKTGLDSNIILPGFYPNIEDIYPIVDAFLMPSFIEGWSIAMNEAMFYEKPLIMTDTGGASDVIENNDIGILIPNEYGETKNLYSDYLDNMAYSQRQFSISGKLAEAMIEFASDKEYWQQAGKLGRNKIISRYDFNDVVKSYQNIFIEILRGVN